MSTPDQGCAVALVGCHDVPAVGRESDTGHHAGVLQDDALAGRKNPDADRAVVGATDQEAAVTAEIQRIDQSLSSHAYDYFPRGRLEFFVPGRRWLLFLDPKLNRGAFVAYLVVKWQLNSGHLTVKTDTAYASKTCVGSPGRNTGASIAPYPKRHRIKEIGGDV